MNSFRLKKKTLYLKVKKLKSYKKHLSYKFTEIKGDDELFCNVRKIVLNFYVLMITTLYMKAFKKNTILELSNFLLIINNHLSESKKIIKVINISKSKIFLKPSNCIKSFKGFLENRKIKILSKKSQISLNSIETINKIILLIYNKCSEKSTEYLLKINHFFDFSLKLFLTISKLKKIYIKIKGRLLNIISE